MTKPFLQFLDMSVPVCDEFQFLELIRDDVMLTSVPVIIITGSNRLEDEVRCLELEQWILYGNRIMSVY